MKKLCLSVFVVFFVFKHSDQLVSKYFNISGINSRQFHKFPNQWYNVTGGIKYGLLGSFDNSQKEYIKAQFQKLENLTCLKTEELPFNECLENCMLLEKGPDTAHCYTNYETKYVHLPPHCFSDHWVLHEIMHALGFGHEHQRKDRDCYVSVHAIKAEDPNYVKDDNLDTSFPYDVHSVMHYRKDHFMWEADPPVWSEDKTFGSQDELSETDVAALNWMFCGGRHYCDINPTRCDNFHKWVRDNNCSFLAFDRMPPST